MRFGKSSLLVAAGLSLSAFSAQSFGIEASTDPLGVIQINALGNSDTLISLPLKQPSEFNGVVDSVNGAVVTVSGSPAWAADTWVYDADSGNPTYYLFVGDGALAGSYFTITDSAEATVTLDIGTDGDISSLAASDAISIHPYFTLSELFPNGEGLNASTSPAQRNSELLFPNVGGLGINLASEATYYFMNGNFYRVGGDLNVTHNDDFLLPDSYFILRNNVATETKVTFLGEVVMDDLAMPIIAQDLSQQDNIIGLQRPIEMTLDESGLVSSGAFATTTDSSSPTDVLLVFDNSVAKKNRTSDDATQFYYFNGAWRKVGEPDTSDFGDTQVFTPGTGFIIRKATALSVSEQVWSNSANY